MGESAVNKKWIKAETGDGHAGHSAYRVPGGMVVDVTGGIPVVTTHHSPRSTDNTKGHIMRGTSHNYAVRIHHRSTDEANIFAIQKQCTTGSRRLSRTINGQL